MHGFDVSSLVLGLLLLVGALLSGLARRSFLSLTAVFVLVGFVLGHGGLEVLDFDAGSGWVNQLAVVALVVILFRDGLEVEAEMLQTAWHLPLRKLVLAMPVTAIIVALAAHVLVGLGWTEAFLLGALLSPTDPVLSSSVVTNPAVPRLVRHSLNLESGLNDGLALPAVLAFAAALDTSTGNFDVVTFVLQDVLVGLATGLGLAWLAAKVVPPRGPEQSLYALGLAFATYGVAVLPPHGNGFIAVFVGSILFGVLRPEVREQFEHRADDLIEIVKLGIFVVFGSLLTFHGLFADGLAAVGIVAVTLLVARPVAVFLALAGTRIDTATKAFMSWFGPKGVATMTFSLLVLARDITEAERIFNLAALVVLCSVVVHGLTDTPGVGWLARRGSQAGGRPERRRD